MNISCAFEKTSITFPYYRPVTSAYTQQGSGVIYRLDKQNGDMIIITNYHVVYSADSNTDEGISDDISVYLYGAEFESKKMTASYIGGSMYYDIAVLSVKNSDTVRTAPVQAARFADSDLIHAGQTAIAVGNAAGLGISVTRGIVSVDSEYITMKGADETTNITFRVMRVDTAVNSGNSGGGLYNANGELIGIVNAKMSTDSIENIAYAIPSRVVQGVAENILTNCLDTEETSVQRVTLGVTLGTVDSSLEIDRETGLVGLSEKVAVSAISAGSLADGVLQQGDVLRSATLGSRTVTITRRFQLIDLLLHAKDGDTLTLTFTRDGVEMTESFTFPQGNAAAY